jgi:CheY-like chemotaxis protein
MNEIVRPIMMVEDNPMDVDLTLQAFQEQGLSNPFIVCRDGEEALNFINAHNSAGNPQIPLIMLLDLRLPKVDGIEVLRQARQDPVWKQVPVIILTTSQQDTDIESAYQMGANSYIVKPVDFVKFADVVKRIRIYWLLTNRSPF